ncbi:MAG TPA: M67 family peptidase [Actinobacteria bacterium]|nr:M67 family peptidase [Actinomycetota bacterium]
MLDEPDRSRTFRDADVVVLPAEAAAAVVQHARFCFPEEACGLLAADPTGRITMVYCLTNLDRSPVRYTLAPAEHYHAWRHAEARGWELVGVFHSHPRAAPVPSARDVAGALEPRWFHLIVGHVDTAPRLAVHRIVDGRVTSLDLRVEG